MSGERATVVARQVLGEGFHRSLVTSVVVETARESAATESSKLAAECVVALVEHLPREVYVDFDEVADQRRLGVAGVPMLVGIGLEKGLDVEKPAEVSQAFSIATIASHVSLRVRNDIDAHIGDDDSVLRAEFRLPLHFRYQAPAHATFAQAHIQKPESIWVACPGQSSSSAGHNRQPPFAVEANGFVWRESTLLLTDMALNNVTVDIPVGSLDDAFIVHTVTALVTMFGALFLVIAIHMRRERSALKQE